MNPGPLLVTWAGAAPGSRPAAAAAACDLSGPDRAALLVDLGGGRAPAPSLLATAAARRLEERLAGHLPEAAVASRGATCHLRLAAEPAALDRVPGALAIARDSAGLLHLRPDLLQPALAVLRPSGVLLRADLAAERALVALLAADLAERDVPLAVLKRPLGWLPSRLALSGLMAPGSDGWLRHSACQRLVETASHECYAGRDDAEIEPEGVAQPERRGDAGARRGRGLRCHPQRQAGR